MHCGSGNFGCSPCFTHFYLFAHIFTHFHRIYSFSRLIDMVIHFEGACYRTSYFPPHFSGPLSPWIPVLRIGCSIPALHHCHKNREGPPQGPLQSSSGRLILRAFSRGVPGGSSGGNINPPPFKTRRLLLYLLAFIFTIHAFAMF